MAVESQPRLSPVPLGLFFVFAGTMHFVKPRWYQQAMPPYVPAHAELVAVSGVAEIAGGLGALHPRTRRWAGWWLVALLVAVFPANVHMALHPEGTPARDAPHWLLWARLPLQWLFIRWSLAATQPPR